MIYAAIKCQSLYESCVNVRQIEQAELERDEGRRATWLETRNLEENFKQLVYLSMQEVS